jgi:hypothetical protein
MSLAAYDRYEAHQARRDVVVSSRDGGENWGGPHRADSPLRPAGAAALRADGKVRMGRS